MTKYHDMKNSDLLAAAYAAVNVFEGGQMPELAELLAATAHRLRLVYSDRQETKEANKKLVEALGYARNLVVNYDIDHDDEDVVALLELGMDPWTADVEVSFSITCSGAFTISDVPEKFIANTEKLDRAIQEMLGSLELTASVDELTVDGKTFEVNGTPNIDNVETADMEWE